MLYEDIIFQEPIAIGIRDLAIIPLPRQAILNDRVQPVLIPRWSDAGKNYHSISGTVVGWTYPEGRATVGYDEVEIRPRDECQLYNLSKDLCVDRHVMGSGDNGAPLIVETDVGWEAVGLFSYYSVFQRGSEWVTTDVFTKLNEHLGFISENTGILIRP